MENLSTSQINLTLKALRRCKDDIGLVRLARKIAEANGSNPKRYPHDISLSTLKRLIKIEDVEQEFLAPTKSLTRLHAYFLHSNQLYERKMANSDILENASLFFRTNNPRYTRKDIEPFVGRYDLFRRFWMTPDPNTFMRSKLDIYKSDGGYYKLRESQYWKEHEYREISKGFIFPSAHALICMCDTVHGQNIKFFSISDFATNIKKKYVSSFNGSAIASSAVSPHLGYGFCCIRNDYAKSTCDILDISDIDQNILKKILYNENYRIDTEEYERIFSKKK